MAEPEKKYNPTGSSRDPFDKNSYGLFQSTLYNLPYQRDQATRRNKIYLALIGLLICAMVFIAVTANFKTYVVRVDSTTGKIDAGQELKAIPYSPREAEIRYFLVDLLNNTRGVPLDPVLFRSNWARSQHFLTKPAAEKIARLAEVEHLFQKVGHFTTEITVTTIQLQPGTPNTYQVRWTETNYPISSNAVGVPNKENYVALMSFQVVPPTNEKEMMINPLGLFVTDLTWAKESEFGRSE